MSKRILMVSDDPDIRQILQDRLHSYGYVVEVAIGGNEALKALRCDGFDGMLVDIAIPPIEGLAVVYQVRASHPTLPVVIITALFDLERSIQAVIGDGPQAYLPKPFDAAQLKKVLEHWVGRP